MRKLLITSTYLFMILCHITLGLCGGPDCSNTYPGQLVSDPDNCHNYYVCPDGEGNSQVCPDGGCFDPIGYCAEATSAYCSTNCQETNMTTAFTTTSSSSSATTQISVTTKPITTPTPITTTVEITATTGQTPVTTFPGCDGESLGTLVPDPNDCHNYYLCGFEGQPPVLITCLNDQCFDPVNAICSISYCSICLGTTDSATTTTPTDITTQAIRTTPFLMCGDEFPGTMIPDPINCRDYFVCTVTGDWHLVPCPGDGCFIAALNTCYSNAQYCHSYCGDDPTTSAKTTSTGYSTISSTEESTTPTTTSARESTITSTEETTTTTPTARPTTSTDTSDDCYDVNYYWCPGEGYYAKCNYCTPEYFHCHSYGAWAHEFVCPWPLVFNPDPAYPDCISPYNCPYHPDMVTTTTPEPISGCTEISDFYCPGHGYYAKCDYCVPEYYHCNHHGGHPTQGQCSGHMMFNPDPHYPYCVDPYNCPHHH